MALGEVCEFWARWQPSAVAIAQDGAELTWAALERRSGRIAAGLAAAGVLPGDRVAILGMNALSWCELAIGTLRAGAAVVPLNIRATTPELAHMIDLVGPSVIAYDRTLAPRYAPLAADRPHIRRVALDGVANADTTLDVLARGDSAPPDVRVGGSDPAVIAFTSGTTGYPKGAVLTHDNVLATINAYTRFEGYNCETVMLCCVPLAFTGGIINNFLTAFGVGGTLLLEEFDPARALRLIAEYPVTTMTGVPIMYEGIAAVPGFAEADLSALRTAITGGALVPEALLRRYEAKGVQIRQAYSLTEACGNTTLLPRTHVLSKRDSAGVPSVHTEVRIVGPSGAEMPVGEAGEIVVRGPQVGAGYWSDPEATAAALVDGWLHTGDVGALDADGFLRVVDRKKDMIISGGLNVYPAEIERVIGEFPGVAEVAAIGVPHDRWGETVAVVIHTVEPAAVEPAAVEPAGVEISNVEAAGVEDDPVERGRVESGDVEGGLVEVDDVERRDVEDSDVDTYVEKLYGFCRDTLSDYKVPRYVTITREPLPRSMSGKILRRVLRDRFDVAGAHRTAAS